MRIRPQPVCTGPLSSVVACSLLASAPAMAQQTQELEEVIVTASKRETTVQDLPAAVTAVTSAQLDRMGVTNLRDLATALPAVTFVPTSDSTTKVVLRGISTGNNNDAASSATGVYLDDVPMGSAYGPGGMELQLVDLERIEVLRGPQGTLYGAGSMGGTIRYVTRQPSLTEYEGFVMANAGQVQGATDAATLGVSAALNVPVLQDRMAVRLVGYHRDNEGWISSPTRGDDAVNGSDWSGGRAALRWDPSDRWSFTLMGVYQRTHTDGGNQVDVSPQKRPLAGDLTQSLSTIPTVSEVRSRIGNLVLTGDLGWASLTSSTSYANFERNQGVDDSRTFPFSAGLALVPGSTSIPEIFYSEDTGKSEELRLASQGNERFDWLAGLYYQDYELAGNRTIRTAGGATSLVLLDGTTIQNRETYAFFGEGTYHFTEHWELTLGGRYARIKTENSQALRGALLGPGSIIDTRGDNTNYFTPKAQLGWRPTGELLLYALYSEGYRPGGPNLQYPVVQVPLTYKEDTVKNYELGAKSEWLDGAFVANLAVFRADFKDLQVVATTGGLPFFGNAGAAESLGVELELHATLATGFSAQLAVTYDDAKFTRAAPQLQAQADTEIPQIPQWTVAAAVDYRVPLGAFEGFLHLDGRHVEDSLASTAVSFGGARLDAYDTLNGRIGIGTDRFEGWLYVENITDERALLNLAGVTPTSAPAVTAFRATMLRPRTIGLQLAWNF